MHGCAPCSLRLPLVVVLCALTAGACAVDNAGLAVIGDVGSGGNASTAGRGGGGSGGKGGGGDHATASGGKGTGTGGVGSGGGKNGTTWGNGGPSSGGGRGGASDMGGAGARPGLPMCDADLKDKTACAPGSADCRKTCGVSNRATEPCSCVAGQWACDDCVYPSGGDYSCYDLPNGFVSPCPAGTRSGAVSCTTLCSLCSGYVDSTGLPKVGYCACEEGNDGSRTYQCASVAEWPSQR